MIIQKLPFQLFAAALLAVFAVGCSGGDSSSSSSTTGSNNGAKASGKTPVKLVFVTNGISDFWKIGEAGVKAAEKDDPSITVDFKQPPDGTPDQQRQIIDAALADGAQGIAISVKDPANQTQYLNDVAKKAAIVTQDSDAPKSDRNCYIGTSNVDAGKQAGEAIKKACPGGGKIMLFVGNLDSANAIERKQGIEEALKGSNITIEDTRTDGGVSGAKQVAADSLVRDPNMVCMVGIYSYNGPAILSALKDAQKVGKVKVVCFDEQAETLAGVKDGSIDATIVQQPFEFGKQAVEMLAKIIRKEKADIPANKQIIIPTQVIDKSNVDDFKKKLDERLKG